MRKTRFIISLAVVVLLLVSGMIVSHAATSGTTGGCDWEIVSNVLEISITKSEDGEIIGNGKMADYTSSSTAPWYSNRSSIKRIVVDDSVVYIGNYAFYGLTSATQASIGAEVTGIGSLAFSGCTKLATLDFYASKCAKAGGGSPETRIFKGCTALANVNFGDDVKFIPAYMFFNCTGLKSVTFPDSVYLLEEYSFGYCTSLSTVELNDKLTEIPEYVFYNCPALTTVNTPKMLTNIGKYAFYKCALTEMELPATVTEIGYGAFEGCTDLHITTTKGSYAALFAEQYGIEYTATGSSGGSVADLYVSTNTHVMRNSHGFTLGAKFDQELNGECVHAAFYDVNGNVVNYIIFPIFGTMDNINMYVSDRDVSTAKYAKIFIWDSIDSCQPISEPETVQLYPELDAEVTEG